VPLHFGADRGCKQPREARRDSQRVKFAVLRSKWRRLADKANLHYSPKANYKSNELALRRVTEVFATAERRRFALQIAENFARNPRTVETCEASGMPCPYKSSTCGPNSPCGE
jgi:hypothetical protein